MPNRRRDHEETTVRRDRQRFGRVEVTDAGRRDGRLELRLRAVDDRTFGAGAADRFGADGRWRFSTRRRRCACPKRLGWIWLSLRRNAVPGASNKAEGELGTTAQLLLLSDHGAGGGSRRISLSKDGPGGQEELLCKAALFDRFVCALLGRLPGTGMLEVLAFLAHERGR